LHRRRGVALAQAARRRARTAEAGVSYRVACVPVKQLRSKARRASQQQLQMRWVAARSQPKKLQGKTSKAGGALRT
jgi:hypothetical protein